MRLHGWKQVCAIFLFCATAAIVSPAQVTLTTLVDFDGTDGGYPDFNVLTQGADGNFYGATHGGGLCPDCGTLYKMTTAGVLTTLYSFCSQTNCTDGSQPLGSLLQASNGTFYGMAQTGGTYGGGTVFKITGTGKLTTLYTFCSLANCADGKQPVGGLVQGRNGNFYGMAGFGGNNGAGTLFEITPAGQLTTLYSFCAQTNCADGQNPTGALVQASNGNLYGEARAGGAFGHGTIFEVTLQGNLTTLFSFDGTAPSGGLIQASDGDFYGVSPGGRFSAGGVFKVTPGGHLAGLYSFCSLTNCADGKSPVGPLVQGTDNNLYGVTVYGGTNGAGTIFQITPNGSLTTLHSFCPTGFCSDGVYPFSGLLQATSGTFYGTTEAGGVGLSEGTIFSLSTGLGPFVSFVHNPAKVGQQFGILGYGLTGTTSVSLNGVSANFAVVSDTFLRATVPNGATTGYVTVTTPGGTLTSNVPFQVIQ